MADLRLVDDLTRDFVARMADLQASAADTFAAAAAIMPSLGAHPVEGGAQIGFWTPELEPGQNAWLEVLTPPDGFDLDHESATFTRRRVELVRDGEYLWGIVAGMTPGTRDRVGDFYHVVVDNGETIPDYLAYSIPFGAFAPAEYYDMAGMQAARDDKDHFARLDFDPEHRQDGIDRVAAPVNILQIHIRYASSEGTLAGLTAIYERIAEKVRQGQDLTPAEQNYIAYDAVQLMPIEPVIEYEGARTFWNVEAEDDSSVTVRLDAPDMTNWGYDVMMHASSAINPALLGTRRPDELLDFIVTLHNFPGKPIMVMLDIVYGHIDNQALPLLNEHFFAGANMYGQNVNFQHPVVRAMLLEMMRRKHNYGVDGIRVDGAQDFKNYNPLTQTMDHDDEYLHLMNDVTLEVGGQTYRPWMIFEDGRPWPRDDWELASSYREVTKLMPNVWQWGPLTFAHNTPFLFTFWMMKWWRIREMADMGREWITGCANHDTLRRGSQVPTDSRINTYLGKTLPEIIANAYDNAAAKLFDYAMMPGVPMDFINAAMRAPWGFIRNTDDRYGVKVVSEEAPFAEWRINEALYDRPEAFRRLKSLGFDTLSGLRRFMYALDHAVKITDYDLKAMVSLLKADTSAGFHLPNLTVDRLKALARAWMDDVHEYCNVSHYADEVDAAHAEYNYRLRQFRQERRWLMDNLRDDEHFDYLHPTHGTSLFYGLRRAPDRSEELLFIANMEGSPVTLTPHDLPVPDLPKDRWMPAIVTPGLVIAGADQPLTLADSEGVVFARRQ